MSASVFPQRKCWTGRPGGLNLQANLSTMNYISFNDNNRLLTLQLWSKSKSAVSWMLTIAIKGKIRINRKAAGWCVISPVVGSEFLFYCTLGILTQFFKHSASFWLTGELSSCWTLTSSHKWTVNEYFKVFFVTVPPGRFTQWWDGTPGSYPEVLS